MTLCQQEWGIFWAQLFPDSLWPDWVVSDGLALFPCVLWSRLALSHWQTADRRRGGGRARAQTPGVRDAGQVWLQSSWDTRPRVLFTWISRGERESWQQAEVYALIGCMNNPRVWEHSDMTEYTWRNQSTYDLNFSLNYEKKCTYNQL